MAQSAPDSLALNGAHAAAEVPQSPALNLTNEWTVELWFKDESPLGFNHDFASLLNKGDREASRESPFFLTIVFKQLIVGLRTRVPGPRDRARRATPWSVLTEFVQYYNEDRPHRTLGLQTPEPRLRPTTGRIQSRPVLHGLHYVYERAA